MRIVNDLPADWFSPGDIPLLRAYVQGCSQYELVTEQVQAAMERGDYVVTSNSGSDSVNPIFKLQDMLSSKMASLAGKLRLSQSSRYNAKRASTKFDKGGSSKLWSA